MRHPFDGVNLSASPESAAAPTSRRSALGRILGVTASVLGLNSAARAQVASTRRVGEEGGKPVTEAKFEAGVKTTLAIGEEGGVTNAIGEQGIIARPQANSTDLTDKQMEALWEQMGDVDGKKGILASNALFAARQVVPFLKEKLKADAGINEKDLAPMLKGLDADGFADREAASARIVKLGPTALVGIRAAAKNAASPEVKRRLQLAEMNIRATPDFLRGQRGVQILAELPGKEARPIAEALSKQTPETWLNEEARNALARGISAPAPAPIPVPKLPPRLEDK